MQTYINAYHDYLASLGLSVAEVTLGIIVFLVFTTFLALIHSRLNSGKFAKFKTKSTDELSKMGRDLASARQQLAQINLQTQKNNERLRQQLQDLHARRMLSVTENLETLPDDALAAAAVSGLTELAAKIGALEHQSHRYKNQIDHLELARMATFDELNTTKQNKSKLTDQLTQANQQLDLTAEKCQQLESELATARHQQLAAEQKWQNLQAGQLAIQNHTTQLEEDAKQSAEQMAVATDAINHLQTELDSKLRQQQDNALSVAGLQADLAELKRVHEQTVRERDSAKQTMAGLAEQLRNLAAEKASTETKPTAQEPQHSVSLAEGGKQPRSLLSHFFKPVKAELKLSKQQPEPRQTTAAPLDPNILAEKDAAIENLKAEISAQQNHIARLEREIEAKQNQAQKEKPDERGIAPTVAVPSPNKTSANPLAGWLAKVKLLPINDTLAKTTRPPQDMKQQPVDLVKEKPDETTDKAKQIPDQLKGLFQKITPFKK